MAPALQLRRAGYTSTELVTDAAVALEPDGSGIRISRSALTLRGRVSDLDNAGYARMASDAGKNCPASKVLDAEITLDVGMI